MLCRTGTMGPCAKRHHWPEGEKPNNETQTSRGRLDLTEANPPYTDFAVLLSSNEVETASLWCGLSSDCIYTTAATQLSKWKCELHSCNTIAQRSRCKNFSSLRWGFPDEVVFSTERYVSLRSFLWCKGRWAWTRWLDLSSFHVLESGAPHRGQD